MAGIPKVAGMLDMASDLRVMNDDAFVWGKEREFWGYTMDTQGVVMHR